MNPDKKIIIEGERHLKINQEFIARFQSIVTSDPGQKLLLDIKQAEIEDKVATISARIDKLRKQFIISFEKESAEANEKMPIAIMLGQEYVGEEPTEISSAIQMLIAEYKEWNWDQERKNDIYFALLGHINFFEKKVK